MSILPAGENVSGRLISTPTAVKRTNIVLYSLQSIFTYIISCDKRMFLTVKKMVQPPILVVKPETSLHSQPPTPVDANLQIFIIAHWIRSNVDPHPLLCGLPKQSSIWLLDTSL